MTQSVAATLKDMRRPTTIIPYVILAALAILGLVIGIYRLTAGLGITTNMNNTFPWGLWIAFDLVTVAFSAGAFVLAAVVSIFRRKEYHGIALPMLLAGFLGEVMVVLVLIMDLARWDQFWSVLIPDRWNFLSSMLWVALALTVYIILMVLELLPVVFERFKWGGLGRIVGYIQTLVAGVGIVLATLHNLSLGALFLLVPYKLNPLWFTSMLPILFWVSALFGGLCAAILVTLATMKLLSRPIPLRLLSKLAWVAWILLIIYLVIKVVDLLVAGELGMAFNGSLMSTLLLVEIVVGVIVPIVLFTMSKIRESAGGLLIGALCVWFGLLINRASVSWFALRRFGDVGYFPYWMEFAIVVGAIAAAILIYGLAIRFFPFLTEAEAEAS
jgi:Ni/Fe-hydrogenase subunit HybB-like protein